MAAGFFLAGMLLYNEMRDSLDNFKQNIEEYRVRVEQNEKSSQGIAAKLDTQTKELSESILDQEKSLASTRGQVEAYNAGYEQKLADLKQLVSLQELDNKSLKKDIQAANTRIPKLLDDINALSHKIDAMQMPHGGSASTMRAAIPQVKQEDMPDTFRFDLLPAGATKKTPWMIPVPE